jgi:hypothetical protein
MRDVLQQLFGFALEFDTSEFEEGWLQNETNQPHQSDGRLRDKQHKGCDGTLRDTNNTETR